MRKEIVTCILGILIGFVIGFFVAHARQDKASGSATAPQNAKGSASMPGAMPEGHPPQELINQVKEYKKTAEREPQNLEVRVMLANLYFDIGRYPDAIDYYTQALSLDPKNVNLITDRATAYHYVGQSDQALAELKRSLELSPTHPQTLFNLGVVKLQGFNDAKGAIEAWEKFVRTHPDHPMKGKVQEQIDKLKQPK